jgi:hypothetical protein
MRELVEPSQPTPGSKISTGLSAINNPAAQN